MRHAGDHFADRRQLLRLNQLRLGRLQLGDVPADPDGPRRLAGVPPQHGHVQLTDHLRAVQFAQAALMIGDDALRTDLFDEARSLAIDEQPGARLADQFISAVPEESFAALVEFRDDPVVVGRQDQVG